MFSRPSADVVLQYESRDPSSPTIFVIDEIEWVVADQPATDRIGQAAKSEP